MTASSQFSLRRYRIYIQHCCSGCWSSWKGRHYSVDWTTGLDYWTGTTGTTGTGLLDSQKLPLEEKGTAMRRAKTPGHKACSSVVVAHLNVASSSVLSHPVFFLFLDGNLGVAASRPRQQVRMRTMNCMWRACVWCGVPEWLSVLYSTITCPHSTAVFFFHVPFFMMNAECGTRSSSPIV